jgi:cell division protein FtsQ
VVAMIHSRALRYGLALAVLAGFAVGGWFWLRDSSFVQVRDVEITGITASEGDRVRESLEEAALHMTTLNVRKDVLNDSVRPYSSVAALNVKTDFPHKLSIEVVERQPVAALAANSKRRVPVTGAGVVLRGVTADRDLPSVALEHLPPGTKVTDAKLLRALAVAGAAPLALRRKTDELDVDDRGVVAFLNDGPELVFGTHDDADAKWVAAARVLAEPSAAGASYLDLRVPGRVAAGGLAPVASEDVDPNPQLEAENSPTLDP